MKFTSGNNTLKWLAIISLLLFFVQPAFTWFLADDFCYMAKVQAEGLVKNMFYDYLYWDGRSISLTYPVCRIGLYNGLHWLGPLIGSLLMAVMALLILRIIGAQRSVGMAGLVRVAGLTTLLWLVFFNFLSQTLYWTTGVGYNMDIVMLLTALWWLHRWSGKPLDYIIGLPVFFYAGTCSPNGVLALLFIFLVQWMHSTFVTKIREHQKYVFAFLLVMLAMSVVILSPGNKNRMTAWDWNNLTHFWTIYFNAKWLIRNLFNYNSMFVWPLIAMGLAGAGLKIIAFNTSKPGFFRRAINCLFEQRYLLAAIISFFFFMLMPQFNSPRTAIQFAAFASLYGLSHLPLLLSKVSDLKEQLIKYAIIIINIIFIFTAASQVFDARYVKAQLAGRDSKLLSLRGQHVILTESDFVRTPVTRRFEDLSSDSSYWLNQCVASHYGLKSIKMIDTRSKKTIMGVMTD